MKQLSLYELNALLQSDADPVEKILIIRSALNALILRDATAYMVGEYNAAIRSIRRDMNNPITVKQQPSKAATDYHTK